MREVSRETHAAYRATAYHVATPAGDVVLRIGEACLWVREALLAHADHAAGAMFITAWNPYSVVCDEAVNVAANARLESALCAQGLTVWSGVGVSADGAWREPSILAMPVTRAEAEAWCRATDQNAVVFVARDGVPELLFHPDVRLA